MTVPELVSTIVLGIPNFAVAFWAIYNQHKTIVSLLKSNERLIDLCVDLRPTTDEMLGLKPNQTP